MLLVAGAAGAEPEPGRRPSIDAVRVEKAPVIDGKLDDEAWRAATPDARFTQNYPDPGKPPSQRTEVRVLYDDRALYVGVRCFDTDPSGIVERLTRRDRETDADRVAVDIDSRHDRASAYHFDLNTAGVMVDGLRFNDLDYTSEWDGLWLGAASRDAGGWSAEFEIPWRTLRFAGSAPEMGFQVRRQIQRTGESVAWAFIPRAVRGEVSEYGTLRRLHGLRPTRLFQLLPYAAGRVELRTNQGSADGTRFVPSAGVDLKLGITSSLTLDAAVNPDFGQVEADQVQLNLSTFEIFFPERRPFFLEGVDLFGTPMRLFYTRRVGRAPPGPVTDEGEAIADTPRVGRIWTAAKLSGQVVPHLSIAALDAITAEQQAEVRTTAGRVSPRLLDPLTNFAVLRLRSDWGASWFGFMGTAVNRFEDRGADERPCPNNPTPLGERLRPVDGRCTHDAYTAALDGRAASAGGEWSVSAQLAMSRIARGPERVLADGTRIGDGALGGGGVLNAGRLGGRTVRFGVQYEGFSPKLDLNDAGFLRRQNYQRARAWLVARSVQPRWITLEGEVGVFTNNDLTWDGIRIWNEAGVFAWARFSNFWEGFVEVVARFPFWDVRETRDGAVTERVTSWAVNLYGRTDPRKRFVAELDAWTYDVQNGASVNGGLRLSLRPLPQIELDLAPRVEWTWGDRRWAFRTDDLGDGSRRYWFGDLDSLVLDVTVRGTYTFTPRLTLQLYTQVFVAGYRFGDFFSVEARGPRPLLARDDQRAAPSLGLDYDFREGTINVNAVLRWEYLPGSTLIGVFTHSQGQTDYLPLREGRGSPQLTPFKNGPATDVFLLKLSYLWG